MEFEVILTHKGSPKGELFVLELFVKPKIMSADQFRAYPFYYSRVVGCIRLLFMFCFTRVFFLITLNSWTSSLVDFMLGNDNFFHGTISSLSKPAANEPA